MSNFRRRLLMQKDLELPYFLINGVKWMKSNMEGGVYSLLDNGNYYYAQDQAITRASELEDQRLPILAESQSLIDSGYVFTPQTLPAYGYGTFGGLLELTAAGYRHSGGSFLNRGTVGHYWSSAQSSATDGRRLNFGSGHANMIYGSNKSTSMSVRCVYTGSL